MGVKSGDFWELISEFKISGRMRENGMEKE